MNNRIPDLIDRIIYEKDGILVVNKPYDIPTSGRSLDDDDAVQYWLIKLKGQMVWAVHQLDADTTGVNIFVTEKKLVPKYQKLLQENDSIKKYLAIVYGTPNWMEMIDKSSIGYIDSKSLGVIDSGKSAHSQFSVVDKKNGFSLIEARIYTGRTHQIRIHLTNLGYPLVGEEWYIAKPCTLHNRQLLHCREICLSNGLKFLAPIANDFDFFWSNI